MAPDDPEHDDVELPEELAVVSEELPPPATNPIDWVRQNRAKAEILAIGIVAIGLIVCMMALVAIGLWRSAQR